MKKKLEKTLLQLRFILLLCSFFGNTAAVEVVAINLVCAKKPREKQTKNYLF